VTDNRGLAAAAAVAGTLCARSFYNPLLLLMLLLLDIVAVFGSSKMNAAGCLVFLAEKHTCGTECQTNCELTRRVYLAARIILSAFVECSRNLIFVSPMSEEDYGRVFMLTFNRVWHRFCLYSFSVDCQEESVVNKALFERASHTAVRAFRAHPNFRGWTL
jgi:hypothetical protein